MFRPLALVLGGAAMLASAPLLASGADAVRSRIAAYRELGASFKTVNDGLRGPEPQAMLIQIAARQIVNASRAQYGLFPAGSGAESGARTRAKPEVWAQAARFKAAQDAFSVEALAFQRAAMANNVPAIRTEARKLGATCKGCHDTFRVPGD
ncbi:MAG: cytochrome c [Sphingomonadales bacterium]|nr:cytochrome c [Sphingomonadales bacterium]